MEGEVAELYESGEYRKVLDLLENKGVLNYAVAPTETPNRRLKGESIFKILATKDSASFGYTCVVRDLTFETGFQMEIGAAAEIVRECMEQAKDVIGDKSFLAEFTYYGAREFAILSRIHLALHNEFGLPIDFEFSLKGSDLRDRPSETHVRPKSMLYVPASSCYMLTKSSHPFIKDGEGTDSYIFDLEDAVAMGSKMRARFNLKYFLRYSKFGNKEVNVRINSLPMGKQDLPFLRAPDGTFLVHGVVLPKTESVEDVKTLLSYGDGFKIHPLIESALGVELSYQIFSSSDRIGSASMGLEDYCRDCGMQRTKDDSESAWALSRVKNAAVAAKVPMFSSVYSNFRDSDGLREICKRDKAAGFSGKRAIHPAQISVINEVFRLSKEEREELETICKEFEKAMEKGVGAIQVNGKMVDLPVYERAKKLLE